MQLLIKVGNRYLPTENYDLYYKYWRDGQIISMHADDFSFGRMDTKHHAVVQVTGDYWALRGGRDTWKSSKPAVLSFKKFLYVADSNGRLPWKPYYLKDEKQPMTREWFIDWKDLLDNGDITYAQLESVYDKSRDHLPIKLTKSITQYLKSEHVDTRKVSVFSNNLGTIAENGLGAGTGGAWTIGAAGDYATINAFEADLAATMTDDLTGEHLNEETATTAACIFSLSTATYKLLITAVPGGEHNGGAYGNGARLTFDTYDRMRVDEASSNTLDEFEMSNLAMDVSGANNEACYCLDGGQTQGTIKRMLVKGDADTDLGLTVGTSWPNLRVYSCIVYGLLGCAGISINSSGLGEIYHNTVKGCSVGVYGYSAAATVLVHANLCQDNTTDFTGTPSASAYNISYDSSSWDVNYDDTDVRSNSVFQDYSGNDLRLDIVGGNAANLAKVDDAVDSGSPFDVDIQGSTRSTWYIGASEGLPVASGWGGKVFGIEITKILGVEDPAKVCGVA